jgi:hypothetical protein
VRSSTSRLCEIGQPGRPLLAEPWKFFVTSCRPRSGAGLTPLEQTQNPATSAVHQPGKGLKNAIVWMVSFHHLQISSVEEEFSQETDPHWLICFADGGGGPVEHLLFAIILPNGEVVRP